MTISKFSQEFFNLPPSPRPPAWTYFAPDSEPYLLVVEAVGNLVANHNSNPAKVQGFLKELRVREKPSVSFFLEIMILSFNKEKSNILLGEFLLRIFQL